ncbi:MAG: hypothetical protein HOW73_22735 [Polyangiaceae bacterium]|nr:hypothetical protein [Polyangiaceae bacterium]
MELNHDPRARRIQQLKDALRELLELLDEAENDPGSILDFDDRTIEHRWKVAVARAKMVSGAYDHPRRS